MELFFTGLFSGIIASAVFGFLIYRFVLSREHAVSAASGMSDLNFVEEIPAGIVFSSKDRINFVNRAFLDITGYDRSDVIRKMSILDLVHPEDRMGMEALMRAADILKDENRHFEFRAINKQGRILYLETYLSNLQHNHGTITVGTFLDVTDRRLVEQRLRQSEEQFRDMFYKHSAIMLLVDPNTGEIVEFNERAAIFYGFSVRSKGYRSLYEINMGPIQNQNEWLEWDEPMEDKEIFFRHRIAHDEIRIVEVHRGPVSVMGKDLRFYVIHDVTDRLHFEKERGELIRDLKAFGHTVSHNLRNSLNIIIGRSSLLENNRDLKTNERVLKAIQTIRKSGEKMNDIMTTLLLFATVSHKDMEMEVFSVDETVHSALERLSDQIQDAGAIIQRPPAWPRAMGYAPWIEEVWFNFISNAIKYGGTPPVVELGFNILSKGYLQFWVKDNGNGVKEEYRNRLFTPFTRLEEGVKGGHGLGLSIVKRIVEKLDGETGLTGDPRKGSIFYFTLKSTETRELQEKTLSKHGESKT